MSLSDPSNTRKTPVSVIVSFTGHEMPDLTFKHELTDEQIERFFRKLGDAFASVGEESGQ